MTQDELVELSGIKKRSLVSYENGDTDIPLSKLQNIASALNVSIADLVEDPNAIERNVLQNSNLLATPLVSVEALGGFGNADFSIKDSDIQDSYVVPDFNGIDFMIRVKGSSMYPKYASGDIVACRILKESTFIQWGKVHVIATKEQGILIKKIGISDKEAHIRAISINEEYAPFDVPENEITGMALVVGVIRLE